MANILKKGHVFYSVKPPLLDILFPLPYPDVIYSVFLSCDTKHLISYEFDKVLPTNVLLCFYVLPK